MTLNHGKQSPPAGVPVCYLLDGYELRITPPLQVFKAAGPDDFDTNFYIKRASF
jgi:hypothetical protein